MKTYGSFHRFYLDDAFNLLVLVPVFLSSVYRHSFPRKKMSENVTETPEAKLRAFISPVIFVILIAIILSLFTLQYYEILEEDETSEFVRPKISPIPEDPNDPFLCSNNGVQLVCFWTILWRDCINWIN
ncbi:MAG: hypothetical protein ACXACR_00750 [Candidatus Hodarchaeales archaeon]